MKKCFLLLPFILALTSCELIGFDTSSKDPISNSDSNNSSKGDSTSNNSDSSISSSSDTSSSTTSSSSSSDTSSSTHTSSDEHFDSITIFSINDLHGCLEESPSDKELGVAKLEYAIKHDADYSPDSSIIISTGDSWEGGYLSYKQRDLTDQMLGKLGVEAMVLGNHDFSWGTDQIKDLKAKSPYPYLGCNIKKSNSYTNDLTDNNIVIERGDSKVGIIGVCTSDAIDKSDLDNYTIDETDTNRIQSQIDYLKNDKNCDIVALAIHSTPETDSSENPNFALSIANTFSTSQINGVFAGHSHQSYAKTFGSNNIPFVQGWCNSKGYSKIKFATSDGHAINYSFNTSIYNQFNNIPDSSLNQDILTAVAAASIKYNAKESICKFDQQFSKTNHLRKFIPYVLVNEAKRLGWQTSNTFIGLHNTSGIRNNLSSGIATKDSIYKAFPFENKVMVIKNIPGNTLNSFLGTIKSNYVSQVNNKDMYCFYVDNDQQFDTSKKYDVITIDYVSNYSQFTKKFPVNSYPQYNLDKTNSASDSKNKEKLVMDCIIDYAYSLRNGTTLKTFQASEFVTA